MANWKDNSSSYNGKQLQAIVRVSDTEIVEAMLYYLPEYTEHKNKWGVTTREGTGTHRIVLNAGAMKQDGDFYSGGLGKSYTVAEGFKRRTLKELQKVADKLGDAELIAASEGDYSPTLIVGANGDELKEAKIAN